jgi:C1A family cysteine protease
MGVTRQRLTGRVKDQGDRPTCVAFAVSSLHEYWRDVSAGQQDAILLDLSEEFLYYGCKQGDGLVGIPGTTIDAASRWLKFKGQCLETLHPYQGSNGLLQKPTAAAFSDARSKTLSAFVRRELKWETLKRDLLTEIPVVGVIDLFDSAYRVDKKGMLTFPVVSEKRIGSHAVLLLEIESLPSEDGIVFLNSWGQKWGDGGIGRLGKEYFKKYCRQLWTIERRKS